MSQPIYIVSGFPRSGTSMMMRALEAGGIPCVYSPSRNAAMRPCNMLPGYDPNPHGFYELADLHNIHDWSAFRGKAIKVIRDNLDMLPAIEWRAVYMRRDPAEIRRSYLGVTSAITEQTFDFLADYEATVERDAARLSATILNYAAVVSNPLGELSRLDWPFNVARAAATIDPALYRHRGAA